MKIAQNKKYITLRFFAVKQMFADAQIKLEKVTDEAKPRTQNMACQVRPAVFRQVAHVTVVYLWRTRALQQRRVSMCRVFHVHPITTIISKETKIQHAPATFSLSRF